MEQLSLDPKSTALVLIDLQQGIVGMPTAPHQAAVVVANAVRLAERFRALSATVVLVRVGFSPDGQDALGNPVDAPFTVRPGQRPPNWSELVGELGPRSGDLVITKHQWGAFYGTELDLQLRRRGIRTIVIGGIATNFGVESTARDAWERNYALVLAEDATAAMSAEAHAFAISTIFPRLGRIRSTADILAALNPN
ncbi:MAG: hydrolase [Tepidisphaeraceae bacterium]|jgi:nicotinamidase-related amidase